MTLVVNGNGKLFQRIKNIKVIGHRVEDRRMTSACYFSETVTAIRGISRASISIAFGS